MAPREKIQGQNPLKSGQNLCGGKSILTFTTSWGHLLTDHDRWVCHVSTWHATSSLGRIPTTSLQETCGVSYSFYKHAPDILWIHWEQQIPISWHKPQSRRTQLTSASSSISVSSKLSAWDTKPSCGITSKLPKWPKEPSTWYFWILPVLLVHIPTTSSDDYAFVTHTLQFSQCQSTLVFQRPSQTV